MTKQLVVSTRFEVLAEEFNEHDKQAGQSFVAMLNTQEEAKLEYQEATGKVHGFNEAWSWQVGGPNMTQKQLQSRIKTTEQYNWLAKNTVELRKNSAAIEFSGLSQHVLSAYASASPEAQERTVERLESGVAVTPKHIRGFDEGRDIDAEEDAKQTLQRVKPIIEAKPTDVTERTYFEQSVGDDGYYAILLNAATLLFDDKQISTYSDDRLQEIITNEVNGNALMKRAGFRPFPEDQREKLRKLKEGIARLDRILSRIELEPALKAV
jgi:hypothetical protein